MQISMARAYLLDGGVFLIDELPNALLLGEARLKAFIRESAGRRTILLCSQNPDMLDLCGRVYEVTANGLRARPSRTRKDGQGAPMERVA
jgi:hypothetical protein